MVTIFLMTLLAITQYLDFYTTKYILAKGGVEYNPIIKKSMSIFGVVPTLIVKGFAVLWIGYELSTLSTIGLAVLVLLYIGVIIHNLNQMKKENKDGN